MFELTFDVCSEPLWACLAVQLKWKRQTAQAKRQAMWAENHLISTAKFLYLNIKVSVYVVT